MSRPYPRNLVEYLEYGAVTRLPDKVAFRDGARSYSFRQVRDSARRIGSAIADHADVLNEIVAVYMPKCAETLISDNGIFYSGNAYLNLDIQTPPARLTALLEKVAPSVILTLAEHRASLDALGLTGIPVLEVDPLLEDDCPVPEGDALDRRRESVLDTDPACIINTSGSTGIPKSAMLTHRGLIDFMEWHQETYPLNEKDVVGSLSPFHFDGYVVGFYSSLWQGAELNVVPSSLGMFPPRLTEYLRDHGVTFIFWVPTIMVNMANTKVFDTIPLPSLRHVGFAGEVFPTPHLNYWREQLPHASFVNYYGPIEISIICTHYEVVRKFADDEPLPIGFACRNTDVLILDANDCPCVPGEQGELCVRGPSLALGYLRDAEATDRAFMQNPLNGNVPELIYRTGDLVMENADGELMFMGRKDFQIKHQGIRIELGEIEHHAVNIESITNACVLYDKSIRQIILIYEAPEPVPVGDVRKALLQDLPKVMLPTKMVHLTELPRNPNGKVDRRRLQDQWKAGELTA